MVHRRSEIVLNKMKNINHKNTRNLNNLKKISPVYELLLNYKIELCNIKQNKNIKKFKNINYYITIAELYNIEIN